jgi:hypothetical protein
MLQRNYGDRIEVDEILERLEVLAKTTVESESHIGLILNNRYKVFNKLDSNRGHYQVYQVSDHIDNKTLVFNIIKTMVNKIDHFIRKLIYK